MNFETNTIIALISRIQNKANQFILSELKKFGLEDLAPIHGDILLALFFHQRITMQDLATLVDRKKSTITTLVEKLIRLGYVQKEKSDTDNRYFLISLTEKGQSLKVPLISLSTELIQTVYGDMPMKDRTKLVELLGVLNQNLTK